MTTKNKTRKRKIKYSIYKKPGLFPSITYKDKNGYTCKIIINESWSRQEGSFEKIADAICKFLNETQPEFN